ncbi:MAG TPA: CaiB/BaiF CoA-transferase family protein [Burkholderiales bacterium]|nr:CaiB/BaiF CoA-transferase family protein [Burkholderiales bacterium]
MKKALEHLRVLDMSRVLAGPFLAQNLADFGADVIKIERPHHGDETRTFPPYLKDASGAATDDSAYFMSINRGKRSVTIDISTPLGQDLVKQLAARADVLIENYKVGDLARYGLDYESIRAVKPDIVYCSITGFGQTGPYRNRPGYDYIFQAMSGLMSITGERDDLPGGGPAKVGLAICDVITGIYSSFAVMTALAHRDRTGEGQHIDMSLLDVTIAAISHINMNYLVGGIVPKRMGTAHPSIVPYQVFDGEDGKMVVAVGNDTQFGKLCEMLGLADLPKDERFRTNVARVKHRDALIPLLQQRFAQRTVGAWIDKLTGIGVPCGPINNIQQVFDDPHIKARGMRVEVAHPRAGHVSMLANPAKLSATPPAYDLAPPRLGEHTREVLGTVLGLSDESIAGLAAAHVI